MSIGTMRGAFGGGVKSVQRGTFFVNDNVNEQRVGIAPVNPGKCFVNILTAGVGATSGGQIRLLDATGIGLRLSSAYSGLPISWEVVEFY